MTLGELISNSTFKEKYVLQKLITHFLGFSKEETWTKSDFKIDDTDYSNIISSYNKYANEKMPMEYVLGYVEFFGNKFFVNRDTLIPRPETEYMIEAVTEYLGKISDKPLLLDIGTGCGVLGTSVLIQNPGTFSKAILTDITDGAIEVAKKNIKTMSDEYIHIKEVDVEFVKSNLLEFVNDFDVSIYSDIILVANLPYIPEMAFNENVPENVKLWEPKFAFVGGDDGLDLYRIMFDQMSQLSDDKKLNLSKITMFLEMMTWQVDILRNEYPNIVFDEVKTFHFNIRIVKATLKI